MTKNRNLSDILDQATTFTVSEAVGANVVVNTTAIAVGPNVIISTAHVKIGNSTANSTANSILVQVSNSTVTANLTPLALTIGTSVVNSTAVNAAAVYYGGDPVARLGTEDQTVSGGAAVTEKALANSGTGTVTPDPGDRPMQYYLNTGAHTLAPGSTVGYYLLTIKNHTSGAGAITTSGWTKVTGDSFSTTAGAIFRCACSITSNGSLLQVTKIYAGS